MIDKLFYFGQIIFFVIIGIYIRIFLSGNDRIPAVLLYICRPGDAASFPVSYF